jgi:hypothetical protein
MWKVIWNSVLTPENAFPNPDFLFDLSSRHRKNLLNSPPATFLASPPEYKALLAKLDAWPNLSALEKATVFVIVRMSAITTTVSISHYTKSNTPQCNP